MEIGSIKSFKSQPKDCHFQFSLRIIYPITKIWIHKDKNVKYDMALNQTR